MIRIKWIGIFLIIIINAGCMGRSHFDTNNIQIDSLKNLPNSFYAFRHGRIYVEDEQNNYRIWYDINRGGVENIYKIDDFKNLNSAFETTITKYKIDTNFCKNNANLFIRLSRQYEFGHIFIDQSTKIFLSNRDGLLEQYVYALADSVKKIYAGNSKFRLLKSGWFENIED